MRFSDEVESVFTHKNLEKTPTAEVQQFVPPVEVDLNILSPEEEQILQKTMHRLAERVRSESGKKGEGEEGGKGERQRSREGCEGRKRGVLVKGGFREGGVEANVNDCPFCQALMLRVTLRVTFLLYKLLSSSVGKDSEESRLGGVVGV